MEEVKTNIIITDNILSFNSTEEDKVKQCSKKETIDKVKLSFDFSKIKESQTDIKSNDNKPNIKNFVNYAPKSIFNISKVEAITKNKNIPPKTESNSKSRESHATRSGFRSVSQSKSQSKSKSNSKIPVINTDTGGKNIFLKLNKSKPLVTNVEVISLKSNQSTSLLNDYSKKANIVKKNTGVKDKPNNSSNIESLQFKKSMGISPQNKRNIGNKLISSRANLTLNEGKNLPKKIMDLTHSKTQEENKDIFEIKSNEINENIIKEVKLNLDDNYKNLFNFSYDNFLNKDNSESLHSKSRSMMSKNDNDINIDIIKSDHQSFYD